MISFTADGAPARKSGICSSSRSAKIAATYGVYADSLLRQCVNQFLIHPVGSAQTKRALQLVEHVDRTGLGGGELHRLGDDGGEHGFKIERRVHRLRLPPCSAPHSLTELSITASNTARRSNAERLMTSSTFDVAVCCSSDSRKLVQ
jgi:hypothetical protein